MQIPIILIPLDFKFYGRYMNTRTLPSKLLKFFLWMCKMITKILALLIGREILKYKRAKARTQKLARQEAQRRMNEFVSIASHELKTPLTSIKGNIQLMGRRLKSNADEIHSVETQQLLTEARELLSVLINKLDVSPSWSIACLKHRASMRIQWIYFLKSVI